MSADVIEDMKKIAGRHYAAHKVELLLNEVYPGTDMDVPDPWYGTEPGYHEVFAMIDKACDAIISKYTQKKTG